MGTVCTAKKNRFSRLEEEHEPTPSLEPRNSERHSNGLIDQLGPLTASRYAFHGILGVGKFSRVYLALSKELKETVAVKVTPHHLTDCPKTYHAREVDALTSLKHPCIVEIIDSSVDEYNNIVVMEYCKGGTALNRVKRKPFEEGDLVFLALNLVEAVEYCHTRNFIHRDIQPKNILFADSDEEQVVLSGFSFAMSVKDDDMYAQRAGTIFFMAPELAPSDNKIRRSGWILKACDVWAVGVTLFYLATGKYPFGSNKMSNKDIWESIRTTPTDELDFGSGWSSQFQDFVRDCLRRDPGQRLTMSEARVHRWIIGAEEEM